MQSPTIKNQPSISKDLGYLTWDDKDSKSKAKAMEEYQNSPREFGLVQRSTGSYRRSFTDIDTNISVQPGFNRRTYEYFRPDEQIPTKIKEIISMCNEAYKKVGLVKNVIDLMGDFAAQGIKLDHPQDSIQAFYRAWFDKINGKERSERFLNNLYRSGNVIVKRHLGNLTPDGEKILRKTKGREEIPSAEFEKIADFGKKTIPARYTFLCPSVVEVLGGELACFSGKYRYGLKIPQKLKQMIINPKGDIEKEMVASLPKEIVNAAKSNKNIVPLDEEAVRVFHYKKDDWSVWGEPMIYSILDNIILLEKLKLADIAACDSAISTIRLWKLGNLEHKIVPRAGLVNKLAKMLENNTGGGSRELIWGPDIELHESTSNIYNFLGAAKYEAPLTSIYQGLGIPNTLVANAGSSKGGFTNNFISMKTLVERLQYGRDRLVEFWNEELQIIQNAMNFQKPAKVSFDRLIVGDESTEKKLLLDLWDRDIITNETILEVMGKDFVLERARLKRENELRINKELPEKASPWHDPEFEKDVKKAFIPTGSITPSELGIELKERKEGEIPMADRNEALEKEKMEKQVDVRKNRNRGVSGQGRPSGSKDERKRKTKVVKPRSKASLMVAWAKDTQQKISEIVTPGVLAHFGKKNMRGLTCAEFDALERIKFGIMCQIEPFVEIDEELVLGLLKNKRYTVPKEVYGSYTELVEDFKASANKKPSIDIERHLQLESYVIFKGDNNAED